MMQWWGLLSKESAVHHSPSSHNPIDLQGTVGKAYTLFIEPRSDIVGRFIGRRYSLESLAPSVRMKAGRDNI